MKNEESIVRVFYINYIWYFKLQVFLVPAPLALPSVIDGMERGIRLRPFDKFYVSRLQYPRGCYFPQPIYFLPVHPSKFAENLKKISPI